MSKGWKIALGISIPVVVGSGYYFFIYRNRIPKLKVTEVDYPAKKVRVKFGKTENTIGEGSGIGFMAGNTYSKKYGVSVNNDGKKATITLSDNKRKSTVKQYVVDFDKQTKYWVQE